MLESEKKREKISALIDAKIPLKEISSVLRIPLSTVKKVSAKYNKTGSVDRKKGSGRPRCLVDEDVATIVGLVRQNSTISLRKIVGELKVTKNKDVCKSTVENYLFAENLKSYVAANKPLLRPSNKIARKATAEDWLKWPLRKIKTLIFSDESRFDLYNGDGKVKVWRLPGTRYNDENIVPTVKHGGGSVMFWGCIGYNGVGSLEVIDGNMDSISYTRVLSTCLHESADTLGVTDNFIFQQDNAPCHKSKYTRSFFTENEINVMDWPAQSPDLNPIENVWAYIGQRLEKKVLKTKTQLIAEVKEIWENIPASYIQKLYKSFTRRLELVIRNKGGHIPY